MENEDSSRDFFRIIYEKIFLPFTREFDLLKSIESQSIITLQLEEPESFEATRKWLAGLTIHQPFAPVKFFKDMEKNLYLKFRLFLKNIKDREQKLNPETGKIFLLFFTRYFQLKLHFLEGLPELNLFLDFAKKTVNILQDSKFNNTGFRVELQLVIRSIYSAYHEIFFEAEKPFYEKTISLVRQDLELAKKHSRAEYLKVLVNYLTVSLDHLFIGSTILPSYIDVAVFNRIRDALQNQLTGCLKEQDNVISNRALFFESFVVFYNIRLCNLLIKIQQKQGVSINVKKELVILTIQLIRIFYGEKAEYSLFFFTSRLNIFDDPDNRARDAFQPHLQGNFYQEFSKQLSRLLNESSRDVTGILLLFSGFFTVFSEFFKININNYKRILLLSKTFFYRKIHIIASIRYLKALYKTDIAEKHLQKIKTEIEQNPIHSLICWYNREIDCYEELPAKLRNELKIDSFITTIFLKQYDIQRLIAMTTESLVEKGLMNQQNLNWMGYIKNELSNIFQLANNLNLIRDIGQLYCLFIDSYIKQEHMEYREDFIQKATALKMQILDINPYHFAIALLYAKVGKLQLLHTEDSSLYYSVRKSKLTESEKQKIARYMHYSINYLPKDEGVHWEQVKNAIINLNKPAISFGQIAPVESRILKVISTIINKITRQDVLSDKLFPALYEESFVPSRNEWDLDPVIIFHFNRFLKNRGQFTFFSEIKGDKVEIRLNMLLTPAIKDKINDFVKCLIENSASTDLDVVSQLEELSSLNALSLVDNAGNWMRYTTDQVKEFVKTEKTVYYEDAYIEPDRIQSLARLLEFFFMVTAKQSMSPGFKYIMNELINNANDAGLKRAHFVALKQDIGVRYELGMRNFHDKKVASFREYKDIVKREGLKVKISMQVFRSQFILTVSCNYPIHIKEADSIHEKMSQAGNLKNIQDVFLKRSSVAGGTGSGIIVILLLLRKYGLDKDFFKVNIKKDQTLFRVTLPLSLVTEEQQEIIAEELAREIDRVPIIQTHIQELRKVIQNPDSSLDEIEQILRKDPTLVADILKMSNSAYYMTGQPVTSIKDAIKLLGLKRLNSIILVSNSYRLLREKVSERRLAMLIKHSELTAFYALQIIREKKISQVDMDDVYMAALLHDIGIILIEGLHPDIYLNIQDILQTRNIPLEVIENLAGGLNHSLVGYKIAAKWQFSELLQEAIHYHHKPVEADKYMNEVFIIYLANIYTYYNEGNFAFENIDPNVLVFFDLNSKEETDAFGNRLKHAYVEIQTR